MPNLTNAKKALRPSVKRGERNKMQRDSIAYIRVQLRKMIEAKKVTEAQKLMHDLGKVLDKAAGKGLIKSNAAARVKSRAQKKLNAATK